MVPAARVSAAIEIMADIEARRRPASDALKDWGLSHRFAGSGDRAAISAHAAAQIFLCLCDAGRYAPCFGAGVIAAERHVAG